VLTGVAQRRLASELGPQIEPWAASEYGVVGYERQGPADGGGCDPEVRVVYALVKAVTDQAAFVAKLSDAFDRVRVDGERAGSCGEVFDGLDRAGPQPALSAPYRTSATVCGATAIR
jgi:hypothetical protein